MFRCSCIGVISCTIPAKPSLSSTPNGADPEITALLAEAGERCLSLQGVTRPVVLHFSPSQELQDRAHEFQLILQITAIKTALSDADN